MVIAKRDVHYQKKKRTYLKNTERNIYIQMVRFLNLLSYKRILIPPAMEAP